MPKSYQTALVAFHTYRWIRVAVGSFQRHFPDGNLLVIDNNPARDQPGFEEHCGVESDWLMEQPQVTVIRNSSFKKTHGVGLDIATEWCRAESIPILVVIEPDCLIRGPVWLERMVSAVREGALMAGYFKKPYGPIHPAPSAWRIETIHASFETQSREIDECHARFHELFDVAELRRIVDADHDSWEFWGRCWDSTQKNWFNAAVLDKAVLLPVDGELDFRHYWCGSLSNRESSVLQSDPELSQYSSLSTRNDEQGK